MMFLIILNAFHCIVKLTQRFDKYNYTHFIPARFLGKTIVSYTWRQVTSP
jgi:hypothetical protein